jgi:hypothetical protein
MSTDDTITVKKRGRPAGSKNKPKNLSAPVAPEAPVAPSAPIAPDPAVFSAEQGGVGDRRAEVKDGVNYNALGLESSAAHKHVSIIWQNQCIPLPQLRQKIHDDRKGKVDVYKPESYLRLGKDLKLASGERFTRDGLESLVVKYTDMPVRMMDYLYSLDDGQWWDNLAFFINHALDGTNKTWTSKRERKDERSLLLRMRDADDGQGKVIRAVMSDRFGVIDNHEVIDMLWDAFPKQDIEQALASHTFSDKDRMYGNILLPDSMIDVDGDSEYAVGIAFSNSEIGDHVLRITPFLFRAICLNGCIWGRRDSTVRVNKKHLGKEIDMDMLRTRIEYVVDVARTQGKPFLEQMMFSKEAPVPGNIVPNVIVHLAKENKLTTAEGRAWFAGFAAEPFDNAFGVINGLTRAANLRNEDGKSVFVGDAQWNLQTVASGIMTPALNASQDAVKARWAKIVDRARELDSKTVASYLKVG